jgi:hypothetical protein
LRLASRKQGIARRENGAARRVQTVVRCRLPGLTSFARFPRGNATLTEAATVHGHLLLPFAPQKQRYFRGAKGDSLRQRGDAQRSGKNEE